MPAEPAGLSARLARMLALDPDAPVIEFHGSWHTWGQLAATADAVRRQVPRPGTRVGVLLRNSPAHVGILAGLLAAGACVVTVNPGRGQDRVRAEVATLGVPVLAGEPADLAAFAPAEGTAPLPLAVAGLGAISPNGTGVGPPATASGEFRPLDAGSGPPAGAAPGIAVEMLTSGTTGPPKRVPLSYEMLARVLIGAKYYEGSASRRDDPRQPLVPARSHGPRPDQPPAGAAPRLRGGVAIVNAPLVHLGGLFRVLQCLHDGRSFCLLERFTVEDWADAVRRHRPRTASLVPAALRMVLDADLAPADLSSLRSVVSGTAPLSPEAAEEFQAKYGIPVLTSYAATEFGGGVAGWNLADHQRYGAAKRGSVGRAHPGCELRVVDAASGAPVPPDTEGLLEVRAQQLDTDGWVRTTDLARVDPDGFVWIVGRADQVIIRGGFKVHPDHVRVALERDPRVLAAGVAGIDDPRLGQLPVAAIELRPGAGPVTAGELRDSASRSLARYELPARIRFVAALPRTPSGKVDLMAVRALFTPPD
jgi:acyl-CoA synthetase (AMP-forming)/AMP-acid ligase II